MKRLKRLLGRQKIKAHIDGVEDQRFVHGWAMDPSHPERRVTVEILIDGQPAGRVVADQYRYDLAQQFGGDGKWGFSAELSFKKVYVDSGIVTLRDALSGRPIPSNEARLVHFDGIWMKRARHRYLEPLLEKGKDQERIVKLLKEEAYMLLTQELSPRAKEEGFFETAEAIVLLALYLAKEDFIEALNLYRRIASGEKRFEDLHRIMLDFASDLWNSTPKEHIDARTVRRVEIVLEVADLAAESDISALGQERSSFQKLIAYMLRSGQIPEEQTAEKLKRWLTTEAALHPEEKRAMASGRLLRSMLHGRQSVAPGDLPERFDWLAETEADSPLSKALAVLVTEYLEESIDARTLPIEGLEELIRFADRVLAPLSDESDRIRLRKMEWLYLAGERYRALETFELFVKKGIDYLDWRTRYFPELVWLHFLEKDRQIDSRPLLDLLYKREGEDRSSFEENVILLSDLLRWRESAGLGKVQELIAATLAGLYRITDPEKIRIAQDLIHRLTGGSYDDYFIRALELCEAMRDGRAPTAAYHRAALLEDQNLFTLSLTKGEGAACERFGALLESCESSQSSVESKSGTLQPVIYAERNFIEEARNYCRALLARREWEDMQILLYSEEGICRFSRRDARVVEEDLEGSAAPLFEKEGSLWLLAVEHLPHHLSHIDAEALPLAVGENGAEEWSYLLDRRSWERYVEDPSRPLSWSDIRRIRAKIREDIDRFRVTDFRRMEPGLLSFKNIEGDALERLVDLARPILAADELPKATAYLSELYADGRVETPVAVNLEETALIRIKKAKKPMDENDLACFLVQRNEHMRLEGFFDYYRRMGVSRFYVIDNASDDGKTLDLLLDQEDVELYSTPQAYSQSLYGVRWAELLIKSKRLGRWNLVLDADEILMLDEEHADLPSLCRALEAQNCDALYTPFLDMYSDLPINQTPYRPGVDILKDCGYHDRIFYTTYAIYGGIIGETPTYFGGVRSRAFGLDRVVLNKLPLFKYTPKMRLREGLHWIDHARFKRGEAVLLHFKYIETFHEYVEREIARGQHWNGASEYRKYHEMLRNDPEFSLYDPVLSVRFTGVRDFYERFGSDKVETKEEPY
ncbi:glycosyltransferase family 2 protein [Nitratifractor sp.]